MGDFTVTVKDISGKQVRGNLKVNDGDITQDSEGRAAITNLPKDWERISAFIKNADNGDGKFTVAEIGTGLENAEAAGVINVEVKEGNLEIINAPQQESDAANKELSQAQNKLKTAQAEQATAQAALDKAKKDLTAAEAEQKTAQDTLTQAKTDLATAEAEQKTTQDTMKDEVKDLSRLREKEINLKREGLPFFHFWQRKDAQKAIKDAISATKKKQDDIKKTGLAISEEVDNVQFELYEVDNAKSEIETSKLNIARLENAVKQKTAELLPKDAAVTAAEAAVRGAKEKVDQATKAVETANKAVDAAKVRADAKAAEAAKIGSTGATGTMGAASVKIPQGPVEQWTHFLEDLGGDRKFTLSADGKTLTRTINTTKNRAWPFKDIPVTVTFTLNITADNGGNLTINATITETEDGKKPSIKTMKPITIDQHTGVKTDDLRTVGIVLPDVLERVIENKMSITGLKTGRITQEEIEKFWADVSRFARRSGLDLDKAASMYAESGSFCYMTDEDDKKYENLQSGMDGHIGNLKDAASWYKTKAGIKDEYASKIPLLINKITTKFYPGRTYDNLNQAEQTSVMKAVVFSPWLAANLTEDMLDRYFGFKEPVDRREEEKRASTEGEQPGQNVMRENGDAELNRESEQINKLVTNLEDKKEKTIEDKMELLGIYVQSYIVTKNDKTIDKFIALRDEIAKHADLSTKNTLQISEMMKLGSDKNEVVENLNKQREAMDFYDVLKTLNSDQNKAILELIAGIDKNETINIDTTINALGEKILPATKKLIIDYLVKYNKSRTLLKEVMAETDTEKRKVMLTQRRADMAFKHIQEAENKQMPGSPSTQAVLPERVNNAKDVITGRIDNTPDGIKGLRDAIDALKDQVALITTPDEISRFIIEFKKIPSVSNGTSRLYSEKAKQDITSAQDNDRDRIVEQLWFSDSATPEAKMKKFIAVLDLRLKELDAAITAEKAAPVQVADNNQ